MNIAGRVAFRGGCSDGEGAFSEEVDAISYTRRPSRACEPRAEEQNIGENQIDDGTPGVGLSTHLSG